MKTKKVMDLGWYGKNYICIYDFTAKRNPYKLYEEYYNLGNHRKKIAEYMDLDSVLFHILQTKYPKLSWDLT